MMDAVFVQRQLLRLIRQFIACRRHLFAYRVNSRRQIERLRRIAPLDLQLTVFIGGVVVGSLSAARTRAVKSEGCRSDTGSGDCVNLLDDGLTRLIGRNCAVQDRCAATDKCGVRGRIRMPVNYDRIDSRRARVPLWSAGFTDIERSLVVA